ncbi:uncharacterized protein At3g49140 [Brachypodium distachyon]|uniref:DUF2470 domain-containing protein n=2 Tax=Brachypodium distachyon TaxID=15368 RepID=A0A0Q3L6R0_BRADI|nr:uncharacterized protein At3g49140 [Brachypodium distachyon]KQJ88301.1 hypothetical protein BRADI_4g16885v3 [Brachypodium distachyon]|eukprot:XP_003575992.1 uncharacterized protein At3g49140 [Brachypodium distachyon]
MLLAAAAAAAPDHPFFFLSRRLPPPPLSFFAARRAAAGGGSAVSPRAQLRRCRSQTRSHHSSHCRSHSSPSSWCGNVHARRSRHCRVGATTPDELPPGRGGSYHPSEDIAETLQLNDGEPARLTDAESARTIVEVHNKATVMISTLIDDGVHERIILPEFPYLTDENGDIYFEVDNEDTVMESIMGDDKLAHVIIGLDNTEVFADLDLAASSAEFVQEDDEDDDDSDDEESDFEDDFEEEGVFDVDEEDGGDDDDDDEDAPSWSNLETLNSCHPLYFARMIVESANKSSIDWLDRPPASLVVEGQLRPAFAEESTMVSRHLLNGDEPLKDRKESGATFFKVEVLSIELITAYGTEPKVKIEEYRRSRPDIIAHSAPNIISRLRAGGDKITQALKSLCWRCKAIKVEEAAIIGVDCLGFDLRLCSGTQVQTLRFAFPTKATSEFSAEKQIHELLFPRIHQEGQSPQTQQKES